MARSRQARGDREESLVKFVARHQEETFPVVVERSGTGYRVRVREEWIEAELVEANDVLRLLRLADGRQFLLVHHASGASHEVSFGEKRVHLELHDPLAMRRNRIEEMTGGAASIKALMPGRVIRILVAEGDEVENGAGLLILEAMKMENRITAPRAGRVVALRVDPGQTVEGGAELLTLE